ncbi:MAG: response regulator [Planctomycetota bacterium]
MNEGTTERAGRPAAPRLAVIDDDASVARALARLLRSSDYDVETFESAEAFLERALESDHDCLVLDLHLPGLDGVELQARLRAEGNAVPVIFITAYDSEDARRSAIADGASAFLHKPLDSPRLLEEISRVLGE